MQTIPLEQAEAHLALILAKLMPGEEVVLTRDRTPGARQYARRTRDDGSRVQAWGR